MNVLSGMLNLDDITLNEQENVLNRLRSKIKNESRDNSRSSLDDHLITY